MSFLHRSFNRQFPLHNNAFASSSSALFSLSTLRALHQNSKSFLAASPSASSSFAATSSMYSTLTKSSMLMSPISMINSKQSYLIPMSERQQHRRNFSSEFGQLPRPRRFNPLGAYLFLFVGMGGAFYLFTCEPGYFTTKVYSDGFTTTTTIPYHVQPTLIGQPDYVISSLWRRVIAFLIDNTLISLFFQAVHMALAGQYEATSMPVAIFASFAYEVLCYVYGDGKTLGKYLTNIKVLTDNGTPITYGVAIKYTMAKILNIFFMADALYGAFDISGERKCIHNVFSRTVVVQPLAPVTKSTMTTVRHS